MENDPRIVIILTIYFPINSSENTISDRRLLKLVMAGGRKILEVKVSQFFSKLEVVG